jgi:hypothetical protein
VQLAASNKLTQDLKAALLLVCGVLKQTSFVEPDVSRAPRPAIAPAAPLPTCHRQRRLQPHPVAPA